MWCVGAKAGECQDPELLVVQGLNYYCNIESFTNLSWISEFRTGIVGPASSVART